MIYLWLKFIHVVSSTILFGTGIGTACTMLYGHHTKKIDVITAITRYVVIVDWIFTTSSGVIQLITGLLMVYIAGYSFTSFWIIASIIGYFVAVFCWIPVVYLQIKMRDFAIHAKQNNSALSLQYYRYYNYWFYLGWPAFISLIIVFYLMTNKPIV